MAYEKHNWQTGEVITADKLNRIESGVDDSLNGFDLVIEMTNSDADDKPEGLHFDSVQGISYDELLNKFNAKEILKAKLIMNQTTYSVVTCCIGGERFTGPSGGGYAVEFSCIIGGAMIRITVLSGRINFSYEATTISRSYTYSDGVYTLSEVSEESSSGGGGTTL